jgi:hypothetical protein
MLTDLEVYTPRVFAPPFETSSTTAQRDPVQVRGITGLGPVAAAITSTPYGSIDGAAYTGASVGMRNIVLTLGLNPNWAEQTVSSLRQLVYGYFMPKNPVTLKFTRQGLPTCEIDGFVETVEPAIFSQDPELQVSILCPSPYFVDSVETVLTGNSRLLADTGTTVINYSGTVPTGFRLDVIRGGTSYDDVVEVSNFNINTEQLDLTADIDTVYDLRVSTVPGEKYARRITKSNGVFLNTLGRVDPASEWPQLYPGLNDFAVRANLSNLVWTMRYRNRYGGL